jgi:hypothetical protein
MDPVYLTEPLVRTSDWVLNTGLQVRCLVLGEPFLSLFANFGELAKIAE